MKRIFLVLSIIFTFLLFTDVSYSVDSSSKSQQTEEYQKKDMKGLIGSFYKSTGIYGLTNSNAISDFSQSGGRIIMIAICILLFYLAIAKNFEPLLLLPIGFGGLLANIPIADIAGPDGFLGILYNTEMSIIYEKYKLIFFFANPAF